MVICTWQTFACADSSLDLHRWEHTCIANIIMNAFGRPVDCLVLAMS